MYHGHYDFYTKRYEKLFGTEEFIRWKYIYMNYDEVRVGTSKIANRINKFKPAPF